MNTDDLVQLHSNLGLLQECFWSSGVPEDISQEDLERINEVKIMIEKMVKYMKLRKMKL